MIKRAKYRIRKVGRQSCWFGSDYPWRFLCRWCGRKAHHAKHSDCVQHMIKHDCSAGSLW